MSEIISSDVEESQKSIFWCKKTWISVVPRRIDIPASNTDMGLDNDEKKGKNKRKNKTVHHVCCRGSGGHARLPVKPFPNVPC